MIMSNLVPVIWHTSFFAAAAVVVGIDATSAGGVVGTSMGTLVVESVRERVQRT
jgi:hypothetical protein